MIVIDFFLKKIMIQSTFVMVDLKEDVCLLNLSNGFLINIDLYQELILKIIFLFIDNVCMN